MKRAIFLIIPMIVFIASCKKEDDALGRYALYGKWKLSSSCGGVVGCLPASDDYITAFEVTEKEIIEQSINSKTRASAYYKKSNYVFVNVEVHKSKVTYNLRLEDGTLYDIEVLKGRLVLQDEIFQKFYNKL